MSPRQSWWSLECGKVATGGSLGARVTECENEAFWSGLFKDLKERGLTGVQLVVLGGHTGTQKAAPAVFLGTSRQISQVHCMRVALNNIPKKD